MFPLKQEKKESENAVISLMILLNNRKKAMPTASQAKMV